MVANAVPGFLPSRHGFRFANAWPSGPTITIFGFDIRRIGGIGDAAQGLCGGMALTARDLFEARIAPPADTTPFANGSPRFRAIVRRQVQSLDWLRVPLRYYDLQAFRTDPPGTLGRLLRREPPRVSAILDAWPAIRADIDAGRLPVVGLIRVSSRDPWRLSENHQTLAFGYEETATERRLRLYDPNHPGRDDVELRITIDPDAGRPWRDRIAMTQSTGEPLLGFFRHPDPPPPSLRAWR